MLSFKLKDTVCFVRSRTFEKGLSDFNRVTTAIFRKTIPKGNPKILRYWECKSFDEELNSKKKQMKKKKPETLQHFKMSL